MAILILGAATDGPINQTIQPSTLTQFKDTYGFTFKQYSSVASTATSISLNYEPLGSIYNKVNGNNNWLYSPLASGTTLYCGVVGGSGNQPVVLTYTPYLGYSDLLVAGLRYFERNGALPYFGRVGGTAATLEVGGWQFCSVNPGFRYNHVYLSSNGTALNISTYDSSDLNLNYTGTAREIADKIVNDAFLGLSPVTIKLGASALTSFSSYLTGGTDGGVTTQSLSDFFDHASLPAEIDHIVILSPATTGIIDLLNTFSIDPEVQPRIYYLNAPSFFYPVDTYTSALATAFTRRNERTCVVLGDIPWAYGARLLERYGVEAVGIALHTPKFSLTNTSLGGNSFSPVLSGSELEAVVGAGIMPITRFPRNDVAVFRAAMFNTNQSYKIAVVQAQICGVCNRYLEPLLGSAVNEHLLNVIQNELRKTLASSIETAVFETVKVSIFDIETIVVDVVARVDYEVLEIKFKVGAN